MYFIYHHMSDYFLLNIVISFYWTNLEVAHITLKMLGWKREEDSLYVSYFLLTWRCPCYKGIPQMKTYIVVTISSGAIFSLNSAIFEIHMIHGCFINADWFYIYLNWIYPLLYYGFRIQLIIFHHSQMIMG